MEFEAQGYPDGNSKCVLYHSYLPKALQPFLSDVDLSTFIHLFSSLALHVQCTVHASMLKLQLRQNVAVCLFRSVVLFVHF